MRVEDYGPGRIRPHERTHPGPKEDRLRLTRATRANLSPIFSLYDGDAWSPVAPHLAGAPDGEVTDGDGTAHRLWRVADPDAIAAAQAALAPAELLIADGHHRYETARVYAEEVGARGRHDHVLMCLVSLVDPGPDDLPHASAADRPRRRPRASRCARRSGATGTSRRSPRTSSSRPRRTTAACGSATSTPTTAARCG